MNAQLNALTPYRRRAEIGESFWYMGNLVTFLATSQDTNGQFGLVELVAKPGNEPPVHVHEREDELFYVVDGQVEYILEGRSIDAPAGTTVFLPRGLPHTFRIKSAEAKMLVMVTPGGFEGYFRELSRPAERLEVPAAAPTYAQSDLEGFEQLAAKYGVYFVQFKNQATAGAA